MVTLPAVQVGIFAVLTLMGVEPALLKGPHAVEMGIALVDIAAVLRVMELSSAYQMIQHVVEMDAAQLKLFAMKIKGVVQTVRLVVEGPLVALMAAMMMAHVRPQAKGGRT